MKLTPRKKDFRMEILIYPFCGSFAVQIIPHG